MKLSRHSIFSRQKVIRVSNNLNALKDKDIYSLILFILYKFKDIDEYRAISELSFILDKKSLFNLCQYFGGTQVYIPTIDELETVVYALLLYQYVNIEKMQMDDAFNLITTDNTQIKAIKKAYKSVINVLQNYQFN